ncbi:Rab-GTPase-TBC domain [Pseudocohnilembus persalinus]|uniref:Rab-GTPase-TBC domain n=1 Tax=Pseudocohnilembus persalinus TaxID=266149 RepID=A0A0V0QL08_PSEPJ|nr:Rab-GTPase-TBC domain [Pseudocohnilembus persalinus]|eukprot:KRX02796.1 Rab-GTPase-TBC domain [Pseudocohnilembus persalinus]
MGFILIYFKDEETSINIFAQIIDQTLQKILENNITYINVLFYKLNRLLQIYVPEVAEHLKQLKIEAGHFSTPWFLTIFTSNCFSSRGYGEIIYEIWDIYLSQRWKGMFKIIIVIFQFYEETILKMKFDELMSFLNNLVKSEFYQSKEIIKPNKEQQSETIKYLNLDKIQPLYGLKSKVDKIDLSEKLLDTLETEHKVMKGAINNIIDKQYQKK